MQLEDVDVNSLLSMSALEPDAPRRGFADVNFSSSMSAVDADAPCRGFFSMSTLLPRFLLSMPSMPFVWAMQMPVMALDGVLATDVNSSSLDVCHRCADVNFSSFDVCFRCFLGTDAHAASGVSTSGNNAG